MNGKFDFSEQVTPLEEFRAMALDARPGSESGAAGRRQSRNRSSACDRERIRRPDIRRRCWTQILPSIPGRTIGASVTIPLRIFDRNQGEKLRTELDISRNEALVEADRAQVFSDVDSAYATIASNIALLRPYKDKYLAAGRQGAGYDFLRVSERRRIAARFPERAERLPKHSTELSEPGGLLSDRRGPNESRRGQGGDSVRASSFMQTNFSAWPWRVLGRSCAGCSSQKVDAVSNVAPAVKVEQAPDPNLITVDKPERFPLVTAVSARRSERTDRQRLGGAGCQPDGAGERALGRAA